MCGHGQLPSSFLASVLYVLFILPTTHSEESSSPAHDGLNAVALTHLFPPLSLGRNGWSNWSEHTCPWVVVLGTGKHCTPALFGFPSPWGVHSRLRSSGGALSPPPTPRRSLSASNWEAEADPSPPSEPGKWARHGRTQSLNLPRGKGTPSNLWNHSLLQQFMS